MDESRLCELRIAGAGIRIPARHAAGLPKPYAPFRDGPTQPAPDPLPVEVRIGRPSLPAQAGLVGDNEPGFSWFRNGAGYLAAKRLPWDPMRLAWTLAIDPDGARAGIVCDPELVDPPAGRSPTSPLAYPVDQILMMHHLATRRGAIHHAAGGIARGKLLLFPGRSGAGKTTITRLLIEHGSLELLSDDRIISRHVDGRWLGYGTPWPGDAGIARNEHAPLAGVFFLRQAPDVRLDRLEPSAALDRFLPVTSILWFAPELFAPQLTFLRDLAGAVPCYDLHFRKDASSAEFLGQWIDRNL